MRKKKENRRVASFEQDIFFLILGAESRAAEIAWPKTPLCQLYDKIRLLITSVSLSDYNVYAQPKYVWRGNCTSENAVFISFLCVSSIFYAPYAQKIMSVTSCRQCARTPKEVSTINIFF